MPNIVNSPFCVYCGQEADSRDHFIPLRKQLKEDRNFTLPACQPCNSTAGARFFETFDDKANFVLTRRMKQDAEINWSRLIANASLVGLSIRLFQADPKRVFASKTRQEEAQEKHRLRKYNATKPPLHQKGSGQVPFAFAMNLARQAILEKLHQTSGEQSK